MTRGLAIRAQVLGIGDGPSFLIAPQVTPEELHLIIKHMDEVAERRLRSVTIPFHLDTCEELPVSGKALPGGSLLISGPVDDDTLRRFPLSESYAQITAQGVFFTATDRNLDSVYEGEMLTRADLDAALVILSEDTGTEEPPTRTLLSPAQPLGGFGEHIEYLGLNVSTHDLRGLLRRMDITAALGLRSVSAVLPVTARQGAPDGTDLSGAYLSSAHPEQGSGVHLVYTFVEIFPDSVHLRATEENGTSYQSDALTREHLTAALKDLGESDTPAGERPGTLRVSSGREHLHVDVHDPVSDYPLLRLTVEPHFVTLPVPDGSVAPTILGDADGAPGLRVALRTLTHALIGALGVAERTSDETLNAALTDRKNVTLTA